MNENRQKYLFDERKQSEIEWVGMPEFIQEEKKPYQSIIVRFSSKEDVEEFSKIIGQKLTNKTKSIWHPFKSHWGAIKKKYVNES